MKKRRKFCKEHKHEYLGMAGDICKNCDYFGRRDWKIKENYFKRKMMERRNKC